MFPLFSDDISTNPIVKDIQSLVDFLSIGVGIVVIGAIVFAGIQYITVGDNPQGVSAAKQRIVNALLALVVYLLTVAFLQWIVPGGVFNS